MTFDITTFNETAKTILAMIPVAAALAAFMAKLHRSTVQKFHDAINEGAASVVKPLSEDVGKLQTSVNKLEADSQPNGGNSGRDQINQIRSCQAATETKIDTVLQAIVNIDNRHEALCQKVDANFSEVKAEIADGHRNRVWPETERERQRRTEDTPVVHKPRAPRKPATKK